MSVECVERGLDPMTTNLVVADESRTEKTICLAVSPSLKAYGISERARLFEVVQRVKEVNTALTPPAERDGEFFSSRHEGLDIGTQSVKGIAARYGGVTELKWENQVFYAAVMLNP